MVLKFSTAVLLFFLAQDSKCIEVDFNAYGKGSFAIVDKKVMCLTIINKAQEEIRVPGWLYVGRQDDTDSEVYLKIVKKTNMGGYIDLPEKNSDYDYLLVERRLVSISPNKKYEYDVDLTFLHKLNEKGFYKVKAFLRFNKFVQCQEQEIESPWIDFEIR